jgi:hypothetical protein
VTSLQAAKRQIEQRNQLRQEAGLPPVSVSAELRKLYQHQRHAEFEQFFYTSPLRKRVEHKLLSRLRRRFNDPTWVPTGVLSGGWAFHAEVRKIMRRIWLKQGRNQ